MATIEEQDNSVNPGEGETTPPQPTGETPEGKPAQSLDEIQAELERTRKALKDANKSDASRRKRLEELEAAEAKRAADAMSETEKLQKKLAEAEAALTAKEQAIQDRAIASAVQLEAVRMGFNDPADAMTPAVLAELSVNKDGEVEGVKEALAELAKKKPYLVGQPARPAAPPTNAGAGNQPDGSGAVLTAGERVAVGIAAQLGYNIDEAAVAKRKGILTTGRASQSQE